MWHIDTTVIRLLDGTRTYLHAVIDNFSRRILAWRVVETFAPGNSVAVLLEASRVAAPSDTARVVLADAGVENVNTQAWWRCLKHQWLFSTRSTASRPFVDSWRSTSMNTTASCRIRRFADRRRTRCNSAPEMRSPRP